MIFGARFEMESKPSAGTYSQVLLCFPSASGSVARGSTSAPGKMDVLCFGIPELVRRSSGCPQDEVAHEMQLHTMAGALHEACGKRMGCAV